MTSRRQARHFPRRHLDLKVKARLRPCDAAATPYEAMYPSSLRTRAISTPTRDAGRATRECPAVFAFRIRVSMSAMLSVLISPVPPSSPRRLLHARDLSLRRERTEADAADAELPHVRARPSAQVAAVVLRNGVLVLAESAIHGRLLSHSVSTSLPEGEPELRQQRARLVVGARGGDEGNLETPQFIDLVVLDLRENQLLAKPERVVTVAVEAGRRDATEIANPGQPDGEQLIGELVHARAAKRHLDADRQAGAQLEVRDRLARFQHDRLLAGDLLQVGGGSVQCLGIGDRLPDPDVDDDLDQARHLHGVGVGEALDQRRDDLVLVALLQPELGPGRAGGDAHILFLTRS